MASTKREIYMPFAQNCSLIRLSVITYNEWLNVAIRDKICVQQIDGSKNYNVFREFQVFVKVESRVSFTICRAVGYHVQNKFGFEYTT